MLVGHYPDGTRKYKKAVGATKALAQAKLQSLKAKHSREEVVEGDTTELKDYLSRWVKEADLRSSTRLRYEGVISKHVDPLIGRILLQGLNREVLSDYFESLRAKRVPDRTRELIYQVLRKAFNDAVGAGRLEASPMRGVPIPRYRPGEIQVWTPEEVAAFLAAAREHRLYPFFALCLATGLRQGELLGLKWADIQYDKLQVRRQLVEAGGKRSVSEPKTHSSLRTLQIPRKTADIMERHRQAMKEEGLGVGRDDFVFQSKQGTPIWRSNLRDRVYRKLIAKAGVRDIKMHNLRHTHATLLIAQGVSPKLVQERLGHANIATTLSFYAAILPRQEQAAMDELEELL